MTNIKKEFYKSKYLTSKQIKTVKNILILKIIQNKKVNSNFFAVKNVLSEYIEMKNSKRRQCLEFFLLTLSIKSIDNDDKIQSKQHSNEIDNEIFSKKKFKFAISKVSIFKSSSIHKFNSNKLTIISKNAIYKFVFENSETINKLFKHLLKIMKFVEKKTKCTYYLQLKI